VIRLITPQYVEFAGADLDDDEGSGGDGDVRMPDPNAQKANQQQAKSLEALVLAKNKRILEELTRYRVSGAIFGFHNAREQFRLVHCTI
jgi:hypothetical protein